MGSDLPPAKSGPPAFLVWATKDPGSANLDRIQIVKGWSKHGQSFERIYDVAWSGKRQPDPASGKLPLVGNTVDIAQASYTDTIGAAELKAVWTDPEFDPALDAFYYARVLEIPTPRWTTIQAKELGVVPPTGFALTIQERAWSSPIWFAPSGAVRLGRRPRAPGRRGPRRRAAHATRGREDAVGAQHGDGATLPRALRGRRPAPDHRSGWGCASLTEIGNPLHGDVLGAAAPYDIQDGRIRTTLSGSVFDVTVYRVGERHYAARENEFGFANYEVDRVEE